MNAMYYVDPLAESTRKGRCGIRRHHTSATTHDTSATTSAARASAKFVGACKYAEDDNDDF